MPPLDEPSQTIEQQFDIHCEVVFDMLGKFPQKLDRLVYHTTRQAYVVYELNSEISELSSIMEEYIKSQASSLIVRNSIHRASIRQFNALIQNIIDTYEILQKIQFESANKPCKYEGRAEFDEALNEVTSAIKKNKGKFGPSFKRLTDLLKKRFTDLSKINETIDSQLLVQRFNQGRMDWIKIKENGTTIRSFRKECKGMEAKDVFNEKKELKRSYADNPIVKNLHSRFCSDLEQLVLKIRKGDYTKEDLVGYFEYLHKLEVLESFSKKEETQLSSPIPASDSPLSDLDNFIFNSKIITDNNRRHQLRDAIAQCFSSDRVEERTKIVLNKKNQLFVLYYVLDIFTLFSKDMTIRKFVSQLHEWFPDIMPIDEKVQQLYTKAVYNEIEAWKSNHAGELPSYNELNDFCRYNTMSEGKLKNFCRKIRTCYAIINELHKRWVKVKS